MKGSRIIAAVVSVGIFGGGALALARGSENTRISAREAVCTNVRLTPDEQGSCKSQMKAANGEIGKQQIATRFQSKVDIRDAVAAPVPSANDPPPMPGPTKASKTPGASDAASAALSHPSASPK